MNYFPTRIYCTIILILFLCISCSTQKEDNLSVFLKSERILFKKKHFGPETNLNDTLVVSLTNDSFTIAFWMNSYNYSKNGVIFSLLENYQDDLKQSILTLFLSKQKLSIISNNKDYRKHNFSFREDFSVAFINRKALNLNEQLFVSCLFDSDNRDFSIYVDGKLYIKEKLDPKITIDKAYLRIGFTNDNSKRKYDYKGTLDNFYIFPTLLTEDELILLMHLTITNNFPLK